MFSAPAVRPGFARHRACPLAPAGFLQRAAWAGAALALAGLRSTEVAAAPTPVLSVSVQRCLHAAAERFAVPSALLEAIALVESGGNPAAVNRANTNGSYDVGLMQINSSWLPRLATWRITEQDLYDPCVSAAVGAWILADNIRRLGPVWRAVGAYNARTPALQWRYVQRVQAMLAQRSARQPDAVFAGSAVAASGASSQRGRSP